MVKEIKDVSDKKLINLIKKNACNDAFNEISRRYERLFYNITFKYLPILENLGIQKNDILEQKNTVLLNCVLNFNPLRKTKFSSYFTSWSRFFCLNEIQKRKHIFNSNNEEIETLIEETQTKNNYFHPSYRSEDISYINYILDNFKDKRIYEIVKLRYFSDKEDRKWKNISKKMKLSVQSCINLNKKAIRFLKIKMKEIN